MTELEKERGQTFFYRSSNWWLKSVKDHQETFGRSLQSKQVKDRLSSDKTVYFLEMYIFSSVYFLEFLVQSLTCGGYFWFHEEQWPIKSVAVHPEESEAGREAVLSFPSIYGFMNWIKCSVDFSFSLLPWEPETF